LKIKYKNYWRKTGLKNEWGELFLNIVAKHKPKHFFEIGVFCGVTARNVCELLKKIHGEEFSYTGVDLFGEDHINNINEKEPSYIKKQKFSNPLIWLDTMLNAVEHMNFFEGRATEYSKASTKGTWSEAFS